MSGAAAADGNLLLGIVALQIDFITREALKAAMDAWVLNGCTSSRCSPSGSISSLPRAPRLARALGS